MGVLRFPSMPQEPTIRPGVPYPLGATLDGQGVNFALYSEHASAVVLCLFDERGARTPHTAPRAHRVRVARLRSRGDRGDALRLPRERRPTSRTKGLRFNEHVVLLDPYAKAVEGHESWEKGVFAYELGNPDGDLKRSEVEALGAPRGVVIDPSFDWGDDAPPEHPAPQDRSSTRRTSAA